MSSRFTLAVGAVGRDGKHASYSTPGSSLFISAPGGDREHLSNVSESHFVVLLWDYMIAHETSIPCRTSLPSQEEDVTI